MGQTAGDWRAPFKWFAPAAIRHLVHSVRYAGMIDS